MAKSFRAGDRVSWRSHGSTAIGRVMRKVTSRGRLAGRRVVASTDDPQYLVRSDKSGRTAVHKPEALKRR